VALASTQAVAEVLVVAQVLLAEVLVIVVVAEQVITNPTLVGVEQVAVEDPEYA
jgi:hypothetical protein